MESTNLRPEDQEAAKALLSESPLLMSDTYAKQVVETGKADNGKEIDVGDFLAARLAVLEEAVAQGKLKT